MDDDSHEHSRSVEPLCVQVSYQEAIISEAGRWTFRQWRINANRRAAAMLKQGIGKEDHVATIFLNGNEVLEVFLAILKIEAVPVPRIVNLVFA